MLLHNYIHPQQVKLSMVSSKGGVGGSHDDSPPPATVSTAMSRAVQEVQGQQLQQAGTGNLDLALDSVCPDILQVPEEVQKVTTGDVDLDEADANQPAAGVVREAQNLEKQ